MVSAPMRRRPWILVVTVALASLVWGAGVAHAGPAPALSISKARTVSAKYVRGLVARLDSPAHGEVGGCNRLGRSRVRCNGIVRYSGTAIVCVMPVTAWNTPTDRDGYYYERVRGGTPRCSTPGAPSPPRSGGGYYYGVGSGHWVRTTSDFGRIVVLEDGSAWEVSPVDRIDSSLWLITEDIVVTEDGSYGYPYRLINTDDGTSVDARYLR